MQHFVIARRPLIIFTTNHNRVGGLLMYSSNQWIQLQDIYRTWHVWLSGYWTTLDNKCLLWRFAPCIICVFPIKLVGKLCNIYILIFIEISYGLYMHFPKLVRYNFSICKALKCWKCIGYNLFAAMTWGRCYSFTIGIVQWKQLYMRYT